MDKWLSKKSEQFKALALANDSDTANTMDSLKVVKQFIIDNKLIMFGGMAIDFAFRLRGQQLYPDNHPPDYDMFSPDGVNDSFKLADIFNGLGYKSVKSGVGAHLQTMTVAVDGVLVADFGHVPKHAFDLVPTLEFDKMLFVHPNFLRVDLHLAFCFPFNSAPREDVFHRWKKDIARLNTLNELYPVEKINPSRIPKKSWKVAHLKTPIFKHSWGCENDAWTCQETLKVALHGFAAFEVYNCIANNKNNSGLHMIDENTLALYSPGEFITVASPYDLLLDVDQAKVDHVNSFIDSIPEKQIYLGMEILSTKNRLLAVQKVFISANKYLLLVSPHYLLSWFAAMATKSGQSWYWWYYSEMYDIVVKNEKKSPFDLTLNVLGSKNITNDYSAKMTKYMGEVMGGTMPEFDIGMKIDCLPERYFPANTLETPTYDYEQSECSSKIFQRNGLMRRSFNA